MRRVWSIACVFVCIFFIVGCGTKRQYFEPSNISKSVKFDGKLSADIKEVSINGASLKNGRIITSNGSEQDIGLERGQSFLGEFNGKFITVSADGVLQIKGGKNNLLYEHDFKTMIASAALDNNTLAVIAASNTLYIIDISDNSAIFQRKMDTMPALDSRIAAPYFLGSLVIFPTLDGKLAIIDRNSGNLIRNVIVSSEKDFNNVIFIDIIEDRMIAATSKRVISISPSGVNYMDADVKDAILANNKIFIFGKDGEVMLADLDLKILKQQKFPFAIFSSVGVKDEYLYIVEKRGYLIKSDLNLQNYEVMKFPTRIEDFLFVSAGKVFYNDSFYTLK